MEQIKRKTMKVKEKLVISSEEKGLLISLGVIIFGNIIKPKCRDVGSFIQGIGIGVGVGTIAHQIDQEYPSSTPHHDAIALVSLPMIFILDKTNTIKNKDISNNLYGIGLGMLSEHLIAEGCSICDRAYYCLNGDSLC